MTNDAATELPPRAPRRTGAPTPSPYGLRLRGARPTPHLQSHTPNNPVSAEPGTVHRYAKVLTGCMGG